MALMAQSRGPGATEVGAVVVPWAGVNVSLLRVSYDAELARDSSLSLCKLHSDVCSALATCCTTLPFTSNSFACYFTRQPPFVWSGFALAPPSHLSLAKSRKLQPDLGCQTARTFLPKPSSSTASSPFNHNADSIDPPLQSFQSTKRVV